MKFAQKIRPRIDAMQIASRFDDNNARIIVSGKPQDNAAKLLCEINETVLARCLQFETDAGAALNLDVAGRRVLRISGDSAAGEQLSEEDGADEVLQAIRDLAEGAEEITVTTATLPKGSDSGTFGLPVAHIAELMSVDLNEGPGSAPASAAKPSAAKQFLLQVDGAKAWLIVEGADAGASSGDGDLVKILHQSADKDTAGMKAQLDQMAAGADSAVCVVVGSMSEKRNLIVCLRVADQLAIAVISADILGSVLLAWRNIQDSI